MVFENPEDEEEAIREFKESKEYVSVSTRLPNIDAVLLGLRCKRENKTTSEFIRDLIKKNINSPRRQFLSGKNKIVYNKTNNSFSWFVQLDSGQEFEVLSNLNLDFIKNLDLEINEAMKDRNAWINNTKGKDSVDIPAELLGGKGES